MHYEEYIVSDRWRKVSEAAKKRAGHRCQGCYRHRGQVILETHHRTYKRLGFELPGDLTVFCDDCHEAVTGVIQGLRSGRLTNRRFGKDKFEALVKSKGLAH